MKEGYWLNYRTGKLFEINEHETWIRQVDNARKLGVPERVIAGFRMFTPVKDRDPFLIHLFGKAPIMRIRGHGESVSFEFWARIEAKPMHAIRLWAAKNAGPFLMLDITNHARKSNVQVLYQEFHRHQCPKPRKPASTRHIARGPSSLR